MDSHLNGGDPRTYKSKFEWEIFFSSLFVEAEGSNTTNAADRNTINPTMQSSSHESGVNPGPHQASASTSTASSVSSSINTTPNNHEHKFWTIFFCHFSILDSSKDSSDLIFFLWMIQFSVFGCQLWQFHWTKIYRWKLKNTVLDDWFELPSIVEEFSIRFVGYDEYRFVHWTRSHFFVRVGTISGKVFRVMCKNLYQRN